MPKMLAVLRRYSLKNSLPPMATLQNATKNRKDFLLGQNALQKVKILHILKIIAPLLWRLSHLKNQAKAQ